MESDSQVSEIIILIVNGPFYVLFTLHGSQANLSNMSISFKYVNIYKENILLNVVFFCH